MPILVTIGSLQILPEFLENCYPLSFLKDLTFSSLQKNTYSTLLNYIWIRLNWIGMNSKAKFLSTRGGPSYHQVVGSKLRDWSFFPKPIISERRQTDQAMCDEKLLQQ